MNIQADDFQYMLECQERDIATILVEQCGMSIRQALSVIYGSETYQLLQNKKTGLYFQSPRYVYSYLQDEMKNGRLPHISRNQ